MFFGSNENNKICFWNLLTFKESAARLQRLWEEEQEKAKKMNRQPSFAKACAKFCQTRVIISSIFFSCCVVLQFLSPVIIIIISIVDFLAPVYKITKLTGRIFNPGDLWKKLSYIFFIRVPIRLNEMNINLKGGRLTKCPTIINFA